MDSLNLNKNCMLIIDTRGHCFVKAQQELGVTAALRVHKTSNLAHENSGYFKKVSRLETKH